MSLLRATAARTFPTLLRHQVLAGKAASLPRFFASATGEMTPPHLLLEIKVDHDNIRDLLDRFQLAHKKEDTMLCVDIVNTIIREAAVHGDAEELSVYKMMEQHGFSFVAENDRDEHQLIKQKMAELDSLGPATVGLDVYAARVIDACNTFLKHAQEEEDDQIPKLLEVLSDNDHEKAVDDFLKARKMAPTRPHPSAPQHGGVTQAAVGAVGKAVDAAVNTSRKFVELKYHHSDVNVRDR